MSRILAKEAEPKRDEPDGRGHACVPENHTSDGDEVCCVASGAGT